MDPIREYCVFARKWYRKCQSSKASTTVEVENPYSNHIAPPDPIYMQIYKWKRKLLSFVCYFQALIYQHVTVSSPRIQYFKY
jgi:hypothetical protein